MTAPCLPQPPTNLPGLASPLRTSLPSLLEPEEGRRVSCFTQQRKYGRRLEFRPAVAQVLARQEAGVLERTRSQSVCSLTGLQV